MERGFFVENDEEMSDQKHRGSVLCKVRSLKKRGLSQDDECHAKVHGIAHVAVKAADDKEFCRSDRSGSAEAADRELPCTAEIDACSYNKTEQPEPGQRTVPRSGESAEQAIGYAHRHESWHEDRE